MSDNKKTIRWGTISKDDVESDVLVRTWRPFNDGVQSWENATDEKIEQLKQMAVAYGMPEERLVPGFHKRLLEITGSDESVDRYRSRLLVDGSLNGRKFGTGWDLEPFRRNPVIMPMHDYSDIPIGQALHVYKDARADGSKRLRFVILFTDKDENPLGETMRRLYKGGFMRASSVGWIPKKIYRVKEEEYEELGFIDQDDDSMFNPTIFASGELLELSPVPIPGNAATAEEAQLALSEEERSDFLFLADEAAETSPEFAIQLRNILKSTKKTLIGGIPQINMLHDNFSGVQGFSGTVQGMDGLGNETTTKFKLGIVEDQDKLSIDVSKGAIGDFVKPEDRQGFEIQTLLFPKSKWTKQEAIRWAQDHDFDASGVDSAGNAFRLRQRDPDDFEQIRSICLTPGGAEPTLESCRVIALGGAMKSSLSIKIDAMGSMVLAVAEAQQTILKVLEKVLSSLGKEIPKEDSQQARGGDGVPPGSPDVTDKNEAVYGDLLNVVSQVQEKLRGVNDTNQEKPNE